MNILFVCDGNVNRSPTFEKLAQIECIDMRYIKIMSAGLYSGFPKQLNKDLVSWAGKIVVFTPEQAKFVIEHYNHSHVYIVGLEDKYERFGLEQFEQYVHWRRNAGRTLFEQDRNDIS